VSAALSSASATHAADAAHLGVRVSVCQVNQPVTSGTIPAFDNLYLDMNGIIHNCTHGNDPSTKLSETEMIVRIFNYLDKLVQIVQPQKLLFCAIDGALPLLKRLHCDGRLCSCRIAAGKLLLCTHDGAWRCHSCRYGGRARSSGR
jgi:XRN 5'-3' exonuclease N-terminus